MSDATRIQVLMAPNEAAQFEAYCLDKGHKKSTLIARLVREHLTREGYATQVSMNLERGPRGPGRR
jgi:hypothetical protein